METVYLFAAIASAIFIEAMPFLVIGALFSAAIEVFVSTERILSLVPRNKLGGLALGIGAGFVLPTCECGVVPVVRRLLKKGVPPYVAIAYMVSAPILNPVVLASTYIAFRGSVTMLIARAAFAAITAAALGLYIQRIGRVLRETNESSCCGHDHDHHHAEQRFLDKIRAVLIHAAHEFMDMGKFLIIGCLAAAAFKTLLPADIMSLFGSNIALSIGGMMLLAFLLSICSEADAFVAASFQAFAPSARLAFISFGPMVDLKLIGMFLITFRPRVVIALIVVPSVLIFGLSLLVEHLGLLSGVL